MRSARRTGLRYAAPCALMVAMGSAHAGTAGIAHGPSLTLGAVSHPHQPMAGGNPAALGAVDRTRLALVRAGVAGELGPVDGLIEELDDIQDAIGTEPPQQTIDDFNTFIERAGRDGYAKATGYANVPLTPLQIQSPLGEGGLSFEVRYTGQSRLSVIDAPIELEGNELTTDTSLEIRGAVVREIKAGYGFPILQNESGRLSVGGTLTHYEADLSRVNFRLEDVDDVGDTITDEYDANEQTERAVGAGLGVLWQARNYSLGATGRNLNKPEMDFPVIGQDCAALGGEAQAGCETIRDEFADQVNLQESWTLDPQMTLEGALYTTDQTWVLAGSVDLSDVDDPAGDEVQWASVSVSADPQIGWIPAWRFGYRENLAGTELRYVTTGLSLFRMLDLDIAYARDSVEYDDEDYPRALMVNLGLSVAF